jgi:hypothetical protein
MKQRQMVFAALALAGCAVGDSERPPLAPMGIIWVMVVDGSGVCIEGATVQITSGPSAGPPSCRIRTAAPGATEVVESSSGTLRQGWE